MEFGAVAWGELLGAVSERTKTTTSLLTTVRVGARGREVGRGVTMKAISIHSMVCPVGPWTLPVVISHFWRA